LSDVNKNCTLIYFCIFGRNTFPDNQSLFSRSVLLLIFLLSIFLLTVLAGVDLYGQGNTKSESESCSAAPDIVYSGGTIITMDPVHPQTESIAIKSDTILAVGSDTEIQSLLVSGCPTQIVDLRGLTILPGFNDSHSHWFSWREHICSVTEEITYPPLEEIMQMLSANGWTSISELNFGRPDYAPEHLNNALDLDARGELSVRLNGYWGTLEDASLIDVLSDSLRTPDRVYSSRVRAPGVKMYVDDPFGTADILSQEQTTQLVQLAHSQGWQIAAHVVNESAMEKIINAYESVLGTGSNEVRRHRIEHAVKVTDSQLNRMKAKGIIASFQLMGPPDWPTQSTFQTYISNTHPEWCLRWNDFVEAEAEGLRITGSTDAPFNDTVCDYSPFRVIYQAVTREGYLDREHADWELAQRLTVENSLKLLTIDGAYATFEENQKGSLTPGKWADLIVLSDNPLEIPTPEALLGIKTYLTMVGGRIEYCYDSVYHDLCAATETFFADSMLISASKYLPDQTPDLAFDGKTNTNWGAGEHPPQWIQVDLINEYPIAGIDLVVDQWPAGQTVHQILAKRDEPTASFELIHEFRGNTEIDQVLRYTAEHSPTPYRYFRIHTTESPSWVSWKEIRFFKQDPTSVDEAETGIPRTYVLRQNFPNPFNPGTVIQYELPEPANVTLTIYDIMGREVQKLLDNEYTPPGSFSVTWNNGSGSDRIISSGIYFYRMQFLNSGGRLAQFTKSMHFLK
jgi:predicted amidohydrolase YtcJ